MGQHLWRVFRLQTGEGSQLKMSTVHSLHKCCLALRVPVTLCFLLEKIPPSSTHIGGEALGVQKV